MRHRTTPLSTCSDATAPRRGEGRLGRTGLALIELVVTLVILSILAMLVVPSAQMAVKRSKELELRRTLRQLRTAIDDYKRTYDEAVKNKQLIPSTDESGYPKDLKELVEGRDFGGVAKVKRKFLRRIPTDPFNPPQPGEEPVWGLRSYKDEPDDTPKSSPGDDVFDVTSLSEETAIDGTKYKDW